MAVAPTYPHALIRPGMSAAAENWVNIWVRNVDEFFQSVKLTFVLNVFCTPCRYYGGERTMHVVKAAKLHCASAEYDNSAHRTSATAIPHTQYV